MTTFNGFTFVGLGKNVGLFQTYVNGMEMEFVLAVHKRANSYVVYNGEREIFEIVILLSDPDPRFVRLVREVQYIADGGDSSFWQIERKAFRNWDR